MTLKSIAEAISGGRVKRRVFTKENKNALILIFPEEEREISYYGLLLADSYASEIKKNKIIIITSCVIIEKAAELLVKSEKEIIRLSSSEMSALNRNLSLSIDLMGDSIYENLVYISLKYPHGRSFGLLKEAGVFTDRYLVWNRIYHNKTQYYAEAAKAEPPYYSGSDEALRAFMSYGNSKDKDCVTYEY